ncbi:MAG: type VI secretion system-associated FHA domain protein TagH [Candidatus Oceanisphaera merdipullorum]|nr:type VI secretion system-associated FHA domain protein TagH [Candidatus Oceanisphaera merdipullorum]
MELVFNITVAPDYPHDLRSSHTFTQGGGTIGRSERCDWPLPDTKRHLSGEHAQVTFADGRFYLTDVSSNGTFFADTQARLPANQPVPIVQGAQYIFGEYQLQARVIQDLDLYLDTQSRPQTKSNIIPDDDFLELDPLKALSQQPSGPDTDPAEDWLQPQPDDAPAANDYLDQITEVVPAPAFAEPKKTQAPDPVPTSGPAPAAQPFNDGDWQQLSAALGVDLTAFAAHERAAVLARLGAMLRLAVTGTMHGLRTRADIKNEMRLSMTVVQSEGNNPLKFCSDYQQAMELMLKPRAGYLTGEQALRQGMQELQAHQVASLAATRSAVAGVIEQLSPAQLVYRFEQTITKPRLGKVDGRYWQAYQQFHHSMSEDHDWRQSLFARHYTQTYEEQTQLLNSANPHLA